MMKLISVKMIIYPPERVDTGSQRYELLMQNISVSSKYKPLQEASDELVPKQNRKAIKLLRIVRILLSVG